MTAKQVQIRRDIEADLALVTPVEGELAFNTTADRLNVGNGTKAGGVPHPNYNDAINQHFISGDVTGTDALTVTLPEDFSAYASFQKFVLRANANNTGAVTVNINGLGVRNVKKYVNGVKSDLEAGDIYANQIFEIAYDGAEFVLLGISSSGLLDVGQGDLRTSSGVFTGSANLSIVSSSSATLSFGSSGVTLPGGDYGFSVETRSSGATGGSAGWLYATGSASWVHQVSPFGYSQYGGANFGTIYGRQRYISASPPFDLGDGEMQGFLFLKINKSKKVLASYFSDVPPWAYNGPTCIKPSFIDPKTGKKYTRKCRSNLQLLREGKDCSHNKMSFSQQLAHAEFDAMKTMMRGVRPSRRGQVLKNWREEEALKVRQTLLDNDYQEITQDIKNQDMALIPHPFGDLKKGEKVVLVDPMDERIGLLLSDVNDGDDSIVDAINEEIITIDTSKVKRAGPKGVAVHKLKIK